MIGIIFDADQCAIVSLYAGKVSLLNVQSGLHFLCKLSLFPLGENKRLVLTFLHR